jgi:hypothetical protein
MKNLTFKTELDYFIANQNMLVKKYNKKVLVIKGRKVLGAYENTLEAYLMTLKKHKLGTFMIQSCRPGPSAYTVTISSSVVAIS